LFIAIEGERHDGHDHLADAFEKGACAAIVNVRKAIEQKNAKGSLLRVPDTVAALGKLGHHCRERSTALFIAVTGSNGKTTVKDMIHHLLSRAMKTIKSQKSFNNFIGVPLTLLEVEEDTEAAVVEMGTNAPGEIAHLAEMVMPHVGVLTNIGMTHLAGLKDVGGVAREKSNLLRSLDENGLAVLNADDRWFEFLSSQAPCASVSYALEGKATFAAAEIEQGENSTSFYLNGLERIALGCPGRHNVSNALAAIAVAMRAGVGIDNIRQALATFRLPPMRLERQEVAGVVLVNDAYNANPHSVGAAISVLDGMPCTGKKILVLGEMAELGEESRQIHRSIGKVVLASGVDCLLTVGGDAKYICESAETGGKKLIARHCETAEDALSALAGIVGAGDVVLFKASREVQLEKLIESLKAQLQNRVADAVCPTV
jgi:UDP-N-acetylmuramoyl-tripeptide--D-alanyl-D-alanine ligase